MDERDKQAHYRMVAKAIARATCDKLNVLKSERVDRDQFATDWWHYFMQEAKEAIKADYQWRLNRKKIRDGL